MEDKPIGTTTDGLIAGIIDVLTLTIMALCKERNVQPYEMAKVLLNVKRDEMPQMSAEYRHGRAYPARMIASTLQGLALSKDGEPQAKTGPKLELVLGGLAEVVSTPKGVPDEAGVSEKIKE